MLDPYQFAFVSLPCVSLINVVNIFLLYDQLLSRWLGLILLLG
jgi:hypothetical protein